MSAEMRTGPCRSDRGDRTSQVSADTDEQALVYSAIDIGRADGKAFISYKVHNPCPDQVAEVVQIYAEVQYPCGSRRRRMVGWERHDLLPGGTRTVWNAECALALPERADDVTASGGLTVFIQSLSVVRAQAFWKGAFDFNDCEAVTLSSAAQ